MPISTTAAAPRVGRYAERVTGGALVLMGSDENAPGMTKVHRALLHRLDRIDAINLDTTYGFQ